MSANQRNIGILVVAFTTLCYGEKPLPEYIKACKGSDPKLSECIIDSIHHMKPYFESGIPELNIPKLDPLDVGDLLVAENSHNREGLSVTAKDIVIYGGSNFNVFKLDIPEFYKKFTFQLKFPHLYAEGKYVVDGKLLSLPIKGSGQFRGNFTDCIGDVKLTLDATKKPDGNHLFVKRLNIKLTIGKGLLDLQNLFSGNNQLGAAINESINSNFDLYAKEIIPLIEKALAKRFAFMGSKIIGAYTDTQLFPK